MTANVPQWAVCIFVWGFFSFMLADLKLAKTYKLIFTNQTKPTNGSTKFIFFSRLNVENTNFRH